MAGIASFESFLAELKQLHTAKRFCDVQLKLVENGEVPNTKVLDVHAFILEMNSPYFKDVLKDHQSGPIKVEVQLKSGELKFVELLIIGCYDKEIFNDLNVEELLCVLEVAVMYANDNYVKYINKLVNEVEINYDMCQTTLTKVYALEHGQNRNEALTKCVKSRCTKFLAESLSPIEEKHKAGRILELRYPSLLYLLQADDVLSASENTLLYFIILWLDNDLTQQTSCIIEGLLKSLRPEFIGADFLRSITIDHVMLNKWGGYRDWCFDCITFKAISPYGRQIWYPHYDSQTTRNSEHGIHGWYQTCYNTTTLVSATRWLVRMTPETPGEVFGPTEHTFVHDGINYLPVSINITSIEGDVEKKQMSVSVKCSGPIEAVRFVIGVVPADRDYDKSRIYFSSAFAHEFLKWSDSCTFNGDVHVLDYWTVDKAFIDYANNHGLYVCLLPITYDEFESLRKLQFACEHNSRMPDRLPLYTDARCSGCNRHSCCIAETIHLTKSMNYSC